MKIRLLFISILFVVAFNSTKAQVFPYLNASSGNASEFIVDADSNIIMFHGSKIEKLAKNFNPIWINNYANLVFRNLLLSKNKNIYFIAYNTASGNGSIGKINANGSLSWCKEGISPNQILLDRNNDLILTSPDQNGNGNITLIKLDTLGNFIKARNIHTDDYLMANQAVIINDSAGIYTVCSWGNQFEGPVNASLCKYSDVSDAIIQSTLIPITYMGSTGQYQVSNVGIIKSKYQSDVFYITQSTSAANQSLNCIFHLIKYNTSGNLWETQFQTLFPYSMGTLNIQEDHLKNTYSSFSSCNINNNKCEAWALKIDSNGVSDNKRNNLVQYYRTSSSSDTTVQLMHHYNNNYFCSIEPTSLSSGSLTIVKMDSTIGSYCIPSVSLSVASQSSGDFMYSGTATITSVPSLTLSSVTPLVTSVLNYPIIVNSCLPLNIKDSDLQNTISLYPNPAKNILNLNIHATLWISNLTIFDVSGKQVLSGIHQTSIDVSKLNAGLYFLKIKTDHGEFSRKFIKE